MIDADAAGRPQLEPLSPMIEELECLDLAAAPADYLRGLHLLTQHLSLFSAQRGTADEGADMLLPLMVLLVIHAELAYTYPLLQLVKALVAPSEVVSEMGYCLATFEAALEYTRTVSRDELFARDQQSEHESEANEEHTDCT